MWHQLLDQLLGVRCLYSSCTFDDVQDHPAIGIEVSFDYFATRHDGS